MSQEGPPTSSPSHEFSCPADPRWRRIHRGGCWEQDLYPLTPAVTPVAPTPLEGGGDGGCSSRSRRASEARRMDGTPPVRQSTVRSTTLAWSLPGLPPPPAEGKFKKEQHSPTWPLPQPCLPVSSAFSSSQVSIYCHKVVCSKTGYSRRVQLMCVNACNAEHLNLAARYWEPLMCM